VPHDTTRNDGQNQDWVPHTLHTPKQLTHAYVQRWETHSG